MRLIKYIIILFMAAVMALPAAAQSENQLYQGFLNPPSAARPRVWWHWMNGNITRDGIHKDLKWMHQSGIAGVQNFDAGLETPQIVKHRLIYMTPEWKDAFHYALTQADSLGMEYTIASSPGWSETGGPWVKDEDGMKKLVWRQVDVEGGRKLNLRLPAGIDLTGQYQDYHIVMDAISSTFAQKKFYRDVAVLAVRVNDRDVTMQQLHPAVTTSGGEVTLDRLENDSVSDYATLHPDKDGLCWVQFAFDKPQLVKSVSYSYSKPVGDRYAVKVQLLCSDDGRQYKKVADLGYQACAQRTDNVTPTRARYFRMTFRSTEKSSPRTDIQVSMLRLSPVNRVQMAGDKGAFAHYRYASSAYTPATADTVSLDDIIDVTPYVKQGVLSWRAPRGHWRIYRFGYGLTGKTNHPASPEATGLEVDKMDPQAIRSYYKNYLQTYVDASRGMMGKRGITYLLNDSYEAGPQTWTPRMFEEFKARRGYDLHRWLPVLTGLVVKSAAASDQFLFDWRMTLGDMITQYHYDQENDILRPYGLKRYTESHEAWRANMGDGMDAKRHADIPMSAFWMRYKQGLIFAPQFEGDIRESASVAHLYGQNIAAAESFTSDGFRDGAFVFTPRILKPTADAALACGLNRFIIHTSPHQPDDVHVPGLGLGKYGQWFDRHETWSRQARSWTDYLSRSCYLLQQGKFVADVAVYYGEDTNVTGIFQTRFINFPKNYNFDFVNPSTLLNVLTVKDGKLVAPSGMQYSVLKLINVSNMSIKMLRRIKQLADAGITICGDKPQRKAGLNGTETEFKELVADIWNKGRANVSVGKAVTAVLADKGIAPDVSYSNNRLNLKYVHRKLSQGDIYWLANQTKDSQQVTASFRLQGKKPYLWHPETGKQEEVSYRMENGRTQVDLQLTPYDAVFVVFLQDTDVKQYDKPTLTASEMAAISTPWQVKFQAHRGAPAETVMPTLSSLSESSVAGIKYFSGEATYVNTFKVSRKQLKGRNKPQRIVLDLGEVYDLAQVKLNGEDLGVVWKSPYTMDITSAVKPGKNILEVTVVNPWHNRMVGDAQPNVTHKVTYYPVKYFNADEPLRKSGLVGPVKIMAER